MKTREQVARYIEGQFSYSTKIAPDANEDKTCIHYGLCEIKQLMDFIYELPALPHQFILKSNVDKLDLEADLLGM